MSALSPVTELQLEGMPDLKLNPVNPFSPMEGDFDYQGPEYCDAIRSQLNIQIELLDSSAMKVLGRLIDMGGDTEQHGAIQLNDLKTVGVLQTANVAFRAGQRRVEIDDPGEQDLDTQFAKALGTECHLYSYDMAPHEANGKVSAWVNTWTIINVPGKEFARK